MKVSEAANEVIALAEAIRKYWDVELPKRHPDYPFIKLGENDGPHPPEEEALRDLFSNLPEKTIYQLLLIMYLGRGDYSTDDLAGRYEDLRHKFEKPEWAVSQMMEKTPLAEYLRDGLDELMKSGID